MFKKIAAIFVSSMVVMSTTVFANPTSQYIRTGYIEDVDREGDFTVLVTKDGNVWFWEGTTYQTKSGQKTFPVGAKIVAVLDGNGTKTPKDDVLVDFEIYR